MAVAGTGAAALVLVSFGRRLGQSDFAKPLLLLSLAPLALVPGAAPRLSVLLYLLVDLRPWWVTAIVIASLREAGVRFGLHTRSTAAASAILFVMLATWAIATTPQLRFDEALHGDEPKYSRGPLAGRGGLVQPSSLQRGGTAHRRRLRRLGAEPRVPVDAQRAVVRSPRHVRVVWMLGRGVRAWPWRFAPSDVQLAFRAWTDRGMGWGTVAVDFGDGSTTRAPIAGRTEVRHRYTAPEPFASPSASNPETVPPTPSDRPQRALNHVPTSALPVRTSARSTSARSTSARSTSARWHAARPHVRTQHVRP